MIAHLQVAISVGVHGVELGVQLVDELLIDLLHHCEHEGEKFVLLNLVRVLGLDVDEVV